MTVAGFGKARLCHGIGDINAVFYYVILFVITTIAWSVNISNVFVRYV